MAESVTIEITTGSGKTMILPMNVFKEFRAPAMMLSDMEGIEGAFFLDIDDVILEEIIEWINNGKKSELITTPSHLEKLIEAASKFDIPDLFDVITSGLARAMAGRDIEGMEKFLGIDSGLTMKQKYDKIAENLFTYHYY